MKGIYSYKYNDDWNKFNETSLPEKEDVYSHLNTEDIGDVDYPHTKRVWIKKFRRKSIIVCSKQYIVLS